VSVIDDVYAVIYNLAAYVSQLIDYLTRWVIDYIYDFGTWLSGVITNITKFVTDTFNSIKALIQNLISGITQVITNFTGGLLDSLANFWALLEEKTNEVIYALFTYIQSLIAWVKTLVQQAVDQLKNAITFIVDNFVRYVNALIAAIEDLVVDSINFIRASAQNVVDTIVQWIQQVGALVTAEWQKLVTGAEAIILSVETRLSDLRGAFIEAFGELADSVLSIDDTIKTVSREAIDDLIKTLVGWSNAPELVGVMNALTGLTLAEGAPPDYRAFLKDLLTRLAPSSPLARGVVFILLAIVAAIPAGLNIATVYAAPMVQELAAEFPHNLLAPADASAAYRRELLSRGEAVNVIRRQGFTEGDANTILSLAEQVPAEFELIAFWLRGLMTETQLDEALHQRGYTAIWRERYKQFAQIIPPVQDLITMAVREAFSPEVAQRFGQFDNFPEDFAEWAERQGLDRGWALKYWAAHWSLPSAMQGFEMLHRGLITFEELDLLLRALDVMPFWRDKLIQIAYLPYTRVDIRRMHQLHVLTDAEVLRAHKDLGYDDDKAAKLTEFVLRLNKRAPAEDDVELGKLSRASVLGFYADGLLPRERAHSLLVGLGHTPEAAALYLDNIDMEAERTERKAQSDLIIEQAQVGAITFGQAQDRLNALGLETLEVSRALAKLARAEQGKVKLPSKEDGEKFLRAGLINGATYQDLLLRLGYSPLWAGLYVELARLKGNDTTEPGGN
jgi:hypothetical protein